MNFFFGGGRNLLIQDLINIYKENTLKMLVLLVFLFFIHGTYKKQINKIT